MSSPAAAALRAPLPSPSASEPAQPPPSSPRSPQGAPGSAGRGGLAIAGAKVAFLVFGFAQQLLLPWVLGVSGFGEISRVLAVVGVVNNVVVATSLQGVSRTLSSVEPAVREATLYRLLRVHAVLAGLVTLGLALAAGWLTSLIGAPHVAGPMRIVGLVILLYGLYAPMVGALNGLRQFGTQARLDVTYSVLRALGMVGLAWLWARSGGSGVEGAAWGFVGAALLILPLAARKSGLGRAGEGGPSVGDYLRLLLPLALGQAFLNLLMQTDFMLLSRFVGTQAQSSPEARSTADTLIGAYRGTQLFAFLPYQLLMSISFVLFPMLARARAEGAAEEVARLVRGGVRLSLLITGLLCSCVSALAPHVLRFAFPPAMAELGGPALRVLALGMGAFTLLGIVSSALNSLGRERSSAALTALSVLLVGGGCIALGSSTPLGPELLQRTALATSLGLGVGATCAALALHKLSGAFAPASTLVRVGLAVGLSCALGARLPWWGKPAVLLQAALLGLLYVGLLVLLRELGRADLGSLRALMSKRRPT